MLQENDSVCVAKECGTFSLSLEHGSVEPAKMLFGDVGLVTCLPGFTLSGGVKCGADADFVPVGSLPVCSPRSCGVPPEVSGASRSAEEVLFQGNATYTWVMLVAGDTGRAWIWSMVTGVSVSLGKSRSRKVTNQFARQNLVGTFPLQIQGLRCHCP